MIRELLSASSALRESIHLPWLAHEAASSPVLRALALMMGHVSSLRAYQPRVGGDYWRAWPQPSAR